MAAPPIDTARRRLRRGAFVAKAAVLPKLGSGHSPRALFGDANEVDWLWLNTTAARRFEGVRRALPSLPEDDVQERFTGNIGDHTLREGWQFSSVVRDLAVKHLGRSVGELDLLDFGCGWGRIIRFFIKDVAPDGLWGIDPLDSAIDICVATNPWARFQQTPARPPTALPADRFDLVYAYSVFSHLSEPVHLAWVEELARVLRPGGLLIATTWPRTFIEDCARLRAGEPASVAHEGAAMSFLDTDAALAAYDRGEFCHSAVGGGDGLGDDFFGETCVPEAYARGHWAPNFEIVEYISDKAKCWQDVIVARAGGRH
jgi:SAM-dependent methyltransferase